jgi:integrase
MIPLRFGSTAPFEGPSQSNPVSVVRKPRQGRHRAVEPLTPESIEELRALMVEDGDQRSATLVSAMAYAGLRPGEALALEWRHVRTSTILVEQAVNDGRLKRQKTNRVYRTVDLLAPLAEDLADWKASARPRDSGALIFARPDGLPWRTDDWNNWRNRHFSPAAAQVGARQTPPLRICRPVRYADFGEEVLAGWADRRVEVGITPAVRAIVVLLCCRRRRRRWPGQRAGSAGCR